MARVVEPRNSRAAFLQFDKAVDSALYDLVGRDARSPEVEELDTVAILRAIPMRFGGLGIQRYSGLAGELACLLSRKLCYDFLEQFQPELIKGAIEKWTPVVLGAGETRLSRLSPEVASIPQGIMLASLESSLNPEAADPSKSVAVRVAARESLRIGAHELLPMDQHDSNPRTNGEVKTARSIVRSIQFRRVCDTAKLLREFGKPQQAHWLECSVFRGSGQWLNGPGGWLYGRYGFYRHEEYVVALRTRLLLPPVADPQVVSHSLDIGSDTAAAIDPSSYLCHCGQRMRTDTSPFHYLDCSVRQGSFIHRHNSVRDLVADFLREYLANGVREQVLTEAALPIPVGMVSSARRADICVTSVTQGRTYFDIAIVDPVAPSYTPHSAVRNAGSGAEPPASFASPHAAKERERSKRAQYAPYLGPRAVEDSNAFVPFVVEATGRLGPSAAEQVKVIRLLNQDNPYARFIFMSQLGSLIARYNARLALEWGKRVV